MALAPSRNTRRDTALPHKFHIRLPSITSIVAPALVPRRPVLFPLHPNLCRRSVRLQSLTGKLQDDPIPPGQLGSKRRRVTSSNEDARGGLLPRLKRLRSDAYDAVNDGEANGMDIDNTLPSTHWSASTSDSDSTTPLSERRRRKPSRAISTAPSPPTTRLRSRKTNASSFSPPVPLGEPKLNLESLGLDNREIPPSKLQKLKKIGSGGFKDVFIGKFSGRRIAISEFRGRLTAMDIKELKLLGRFDHPNIIRFLGVSIPDNNRETPVMIITELCSNGDLSHLHPRLLRIFFSGLRRKF
ncbi:kinase-like domain-containing protein [Mycena sp. CBHHK59/15]|nr:kinase-like domain-containing protein [Mycena sp. CBHHK59/15]KAJ6570749.1 kinase-like domain-containing protein [Mycena sp. CBHHK59/15]